LSGGAALCVAQISLHGPLKRDELMTNCHRALACCLSMIAAQTRSVFVARENRCTLCANAVDLVRIALGPMTR